MTIWYVQLEKLFLIIVKYAVLLYSWSNKFPFGEQMRQKIKWN